MFKLNILDITNVKSRSFKILMMTFIISSLIILYFILKIIYWQHQKLILSTRPSACFLTKTSFTKVPFRWHNDEIYVPVSINGKIQECTVDTGTARTHVPIHSGNLVDFISARIFGSIASPFPGETLRPVNLSRTNTIQIGAYIVKNIPVLNYRTFSSDPRTLRKPVIGNDLFQNVSLTIDTRNQVLVIATPSSENGSAHIGKWDYSVKFETKYSDLILLHGSIQGIPSLLCFDTGQNIFPLCIIDRRVAQKVAFAQGTTFNSGVQVFEYDVPWGIVNTRFQTSAWATAGIYMPFQALIGSEILDKYKVGIDYPAHRIYFRRNE